ncbi:MAG TPA: thiamine pyrophosphate-binding protein [Planctomycetes bacterium]|nr:thiamine pyrophosphate-binding protein [Planctomycetota bacterium]
MLELITRTKKSTTGQGGALLAKALRAEGVETVFGIPDGTYLGLIANLEGEGIRLIPPRHETSAVHMAGAYARFSGKLGVCIASNGPGVANALPGVAVENAEGNRVLLITSARRTGTVHPERAGTFQSFPQVEVTRPMTKWSARVPSMERLPDLLRKAFRVAWSGRPGVVHLDVPEDLLNGKFELPEVGAPSSYRRVEAIAPSRAQVERAADLLLSAEKPMIHAGSGVLHARAFAALAEVARTLHAPVTTSWGARSVVDEREGFAVPLVHVGLNNAVRNEADAVLLIGSRLGETDWWGKAPYWAKEQQVVQVDVDEATLGLNKPVDLAIVADAKAFLEELAEVLRARKSEVDVAARRAWLLSIQDRRAKARAKLDKKLSDRESPLHSAQVAHVCQKVFADDSILILDGGNTVIWGNFFHEVRQPNSVMTTFKMGMLGAGVPHALGAKAANPERQVYCVIGDGAFGFQPQELETAVRSGLKVTYVVLCDKQWGMVKINQSFNLKPIKTLVRKHLDPSETVNTELGEVAWDEMARTYGAYGERVSSPDQLEAALRRCTRQGRPAVVHVDVDPVKHMWAPELKTFKDMHAEPEGK